MPKSKLKFVLLFQELFLPLNPAKTAPNYFISAEQLPSTHTQHGLLYSQPGVYSLHTHTLYFSSSVWPKNLHAKLVVRPREEEQD